MESSRYNAANGYVAEAGEPCGDVFFADSIEALKGEMVRLGLSLRGQVFFLLRCAWAYAAAMHGLAEEVKQLYRARLAEYEELLSYGAGLVALEERHGIRCEPDVVRLWGGSPLPYGAAGEGSGVASEGENVAKAMQESDLKPVEVKAEGTEALLRGFRTVPRKGVAEEMKFLQEQLMRKNLIGLPKGLRVEDGARCFPLLGVLGVERYERECGEPIVWYGQLNQLHYLINFLCERRLIYCSGDKKWETAARVFRREESALTAKQLNNATRLKQREQAEVEECFPAAWRRGV